MRGRLDDVVPICTVGGIFGQVKVRYNILGSMQPAPSNEEF